MRRNIFLSRLRLSALGLALVAGACQDGERDLPLAPGDTAADLDVGLELSSEHAAVGQQVVMAVRADAHTSEPLVGLQGAINFDPARLKFVGQTATGPFAIVNNNDAGTGRLRLASLEVQGLPARTAVLVFEVRDADYAKSVHYQLEGAALRDLTRLSRVKVAGEAHEATDLAVPRDAAPLNLAAWRAAFASRAGVTASVAKPSFKPGDYRLNLKYGDATLDGNVDIIGDAFYVANVSVGNQQLIVGTDSPNRDAVVAGNVDPANTPGLGEPTDANPPGREADGSRKIDIFDAAAIANAAVGNPTPIAGQLIPGRGPLATNRVIIAAGTYLGTINWTKNNVYQLDGIVRIGGDNPSGPADSTAVLNIEPGTRIEGNSAQVSALFIQRNGQIFANGTLLEPIVFTCTATTKAKGCWGGLFIAGNAPINTGNGTTSPAGIRGAAGNCTQNQGEGGAPVYGGCNPTDNSGILRYVRSEYAGFILSLNNELNGITFSGVGSGTTVENIQVHAGLDDGIELFGGTVNLKNLYLTANSDDSFDFDFGWSGSAQFIVIQHDSLDSDKGFEVDNSATVAAYNNQPRTAATVYNVTLVGKADPTGTGGPAANNSEAALHIRRGAHPTMRNFIVYKFDRAMDIDDAETCTTGVPGGDNSTLDLTNSIFAGNNTLGEGGSDADPDPSTQCSSGFVSNLGGFTGNNLEDLFITSAGRNNTTTLTAAQINGLLVSPLNVIVPDFRPAAGSLASSGAAAAPAGNSFIQTVSYIGGVAPSGVPWYSGWTRGWQTATAP